MFSLPLFFFLFFFSSYILYKLARFFPPASPNRVTREGSVSTSALGRLCGTREKRGKTIWQRYPERWRRRDLARSSSTVVTHTEREGKLWRLSFNIQTENKKKQQHQFIRSYCRIHVWRHVIIKVTIFHFHQLWVHWWKFGGHTLWLQWSWCHPHSCWETTSGKEIWQARKWTHVPSSVKEVNMCTIIISPGSEHVYHHHQSRKWTHVPSSVQVVSGCLFWQKFHRFASRGRFWSKREPVSQEYVCLRPLLCGF